MATADTHTNNNAQTSTKAVIGWRYSLTRCMGSSALTDIYWTRDLEVKDDTASEAYVLLLKVNPALSQLAGFEDVLRNVLDQFNSASHYSVPHITDSGNDNGSLWLVTPHTKGMLLSEQFADLGKKGLKLKETKQMLQRIKSAKQDIQADAYGFLEPAALQFHDDGIRFLNAPIVKALSTFLRSFQAQPLRLTLNSGYISPSVAVGGKANHHDDVFSLACIAYHLLANQAPFGNQYVLEAVVHNAQAKHVRHIRKPTMEALWNAMSFQAEHRPRNMDRFIKQLISYRPTKLVLPLAVAASLGGASFAASHLITQAQDFLDQQKAKVEAANAANKAAQVAAKETKEQHIDSTISNVSPQLIPPAPKSPLTIDSIREAIETQVAKGEEAKFKPVLDKIRILAQDGRNKKLISALIDRILEHELSNATTWVENKDFEKAAKSLKLTGKWARDYNLPHHLTTQYDLDADVKRYQSRKQRLASLYSAAQEAYKENKFSPTNDPDYNAARYLNELLRIDPDHKGARKLLARIITTQHSIASKRIKVRRLDEAYDLLDDTSSLIAYHDVKDLEKAQEKLQQRYDRADKKSATRVARPRTPPAQPERVASRPAAVQQQQPQRVATRPTATTQQPQQVATQQPQAVQQNFQADYQHQLSRQSSAEERRRIARQREEAQRREVERKRELARQREIQRQQAHARQQEQRRQEQLAQQREAERQRQLAMQQQQQYYASQQQQQYQRSQPVHVQQQVQVIDPFAGGGDLMEVPISVIDNGYQ